MGCEDNLDSYDPVVRAQKSQRADHRIISFTLPACKKMYFSDSIFLLMFEKQNLQHRTATTPVLRVGGPCDVAWEFPADVTHHV
jgi:hypothetical protein